MLTFRPDSSDRLSGMRKHFCLALRPAGCRERCCARRTRADQAQPAEAERQPRIAGRARPPADGVVLMVHGTLSWYGQETIAALQKNLKAKRHWLARHHPVARHRRPAEDRAAATSCTTMRWPAPSAKSAVARVARRPGCQDGRSAGLLARRRAGGGVRAGAGESAPRGAARAGLRDRRRAGRDLPARLRPSAGARDRDRAQESAADSARSIS